MSCRLVLVQEDETSSLVFVLGYNRTTGVELQERKLAPFVFVSPCRLQPMCDLDFTNCTLDWCDFYFLWFGGRKSESNVQNLVDIALASPGQPECCAVISGSGGDLAPSELLDADHRGHIHQLTKCEVHHAGLLC